MSAQLEVVMETMYFEVTRACYSTSFGFLQLHPQGSITLINIIDMLLSVVISLKQQIVFSELHYYHNLESS